MTSLKKRAPNVDIPATTQHPKTRIHAESGERSITLLSVLAPDLDRCLVVPAFTYTKSFSFRSEPAGRGTVRQTDRRSHLYWIVT